MNQKQVKEKLKQARESINARQYCDAVKLCQVRVVAVQLSSLETLMLA